MINIAGMSTSISRVDRDPRPALGHLLRQWRAARGLSQLELALRAGFSSRHVSFVETGRTQASRQTVLRAGPARLAQRRPCTRNGARGLAGAAETGDAPAV